MALLEGKVVEGLAEFGGGEEVRLDDGDGEAEEGALLGGSRIDGNNLGRVNGADFELGGINLKE